MMRFCGNCGAPLDGAALASGQCPSCGQALLGPEDDTLSNHPTFPNGPPPSDVSYSAAIWPQTPDERSRRTRSGPSGWVRGGVVLSVILVLMLLISALLLRDDFPLTPGSSAAVHSTQPAQGTTTAHAATPTRSPAKTATATTGGASGSTTPPGQASDATAVPTPTSSPAPSATPVPPTLTVQPTSIQLSACLAAQAQFTVANTGGASFSWTASSGGLYGISPAGGTLAGGEQQVVTVSRIALGGKVTVTAPTARNSPQQVTITCKG